uniref:Uncharacterized protein n=1 Tax=Arundo donax TaxID=35708 RepID=A0A0A9FVB8_ARUDO
MLVYFLNFPSVFSFLRMCVSCHCLICFLIGSCSHSIVRQSIFMQAHHKYHI